MTKNKNKSISGLVFDTCNMIFMVLFSFSILYPFLYILSVSFTDNPASINPYNLVPQKFILTSYIKVLSSEYIIIGYMNTIVRVALGTIITTFVCILTAYPLSKKFLPDRKFFTAFMVFTMFFSGGLIPMYILIKSLKYINTVWALVIPSAIPTFSMLIIRNYFMTIPDSLEESAKIDGANDFFILFSIVVPLSLPILATTVLWTIVGHWNAWFDAMLYITNSRKQVLQAILRQIVIVGTMDQLEFEAHMYASPESLKAATIIVGTLPIIMVYPFVQKYFIKGIMIGSLKG